MAYDVSTVIFYSQFKYIFVCGLCIIHINDWQVYRNLAMPQNNTYRQAQKYAYMLQSACYLSNKTDK